MIEFFDFGNSGVVFLRDSTQIVALAHLVVGSGRLRLGRCCLRGVLLNRSGGGNAVAGHEHGVVFQLEVLKVHQSVRVDILTQIANLKMQV